MKIKTARFILKVKQYINELFSKQTYQDFYEDILGIGSASIEDIHRIDEMKKTKKRPATKNL